MRLLLALIALSALSFSLTLDELIANYSSPCELPQLDSLSTSTGAFLLVSFNGKESLLLDQSIPSNPSLIQSDSSISSILREDFLNGMGLSARTDEISSKLDSFNQSGSSWQALCAQWTGTDRLACDSLQNCRLSCISAPICKNMMMGLGDPFVYSIWGWRNSTQRLDSRLAQAINSLSSIEGSPQPSLQASDSSNRLSFVRAEFTAMRSNDLFNCNASSPTSYCFCNITFSETRLKESEDKLSSLQTDLLELDAIPSRASAIASETQARIQLALLKGEEAKFNKTLSSAEAKLSQTKQSISASLSIISDPSLSQGASSLDSLLSQMRSAAFYKDFTLANSLAASFFNLSGSLEQNASSNIALFNSLKNASANASSSLASAQALLSLPSDEILFAELQNASSDLNASTALLLSTPLPISTARSLSSSIPAIQARIDSVSSRASQKHLLEQTASSLDSRASSLASLAAQYNQSLDLSTAQSLLAQAKQQLHIIQLSEANTSLQQAEAEISSKNAWLSNRITQINEASASIHEAEQSISNASKTGFLFWTPNLDEANQNLAKARAALYSDPVASRQFADLANAQAANESERVKSTCPLAYALAFILLLVFARSSQKLY